MSNAELFRGLQSRISEIRSTLATQPVPKHSEGFNEGDSATWKHEDYIALRLTWMRNDLATLESWAGDLVNLYAEVEPLKTL